MSNKNNNTKNPPVKEKKSSGLSFLTRKRVNTTAPNQPTTNQTTTTNVTTTNPTVGTSDANNLSGSLTNMKITRKFKLFCTYPESSNSIGLRDSDCI